MRTVKLGPILNAHPYVRVERPPLLWDVSGDDETFIRALGEMISAALVRNGGELAAVTLNVSNVVVEPEASGPMPVGEFVALTISSDGNWRPEGHWHPDAAHSPPLVTDDLSSAARTAGAMYGYTRDLADGRGSVTVFFPRAAP